MLWLELPLLLNRSSESGYSCLVLEFRGKAFSHSPLRMMLAAGFSVCGLCHVENISSVPSLQNVCFVLFYHETMLNFANTFTLANIQNPVGG